MWAWLHIWRRAHRLVLVVQLEISARFERRQLICCSQARASHANFIVAGCAITGEKRLFRDIPWPQEPASMRPAKVATRKLLYYVSTFWLWKPCWCGAPHLPHSCLLGGSCSKRISKVHVQAEACMSSVDSIPKCWSEINIPKEFSMKLQHKSCQTLSNASCAKQTPKYVQPDEGNHAFLYLSGFAMPPAYSCPKVDKSTQKLWRLLCIFQIYVKRTTQFSIISYDHMIHNFDAISVKIGLERFRSWQTGPYFATDQAL